MVFHWSYFLKGPEVADLEWLSLKPEALNWLQKTKVPIVPITINGSYDLFETRSIITGGAVIDVVIHPAIDTASLDRHQIANITHEVDNTIRTTLTQLIEKREAAAKEKE